MSSSQDQACPKPYYPTSLPMAEAESSVSAFFSRLISKKQYKSPMAEASSTSESRHSWYSQGRLQKRRPPHQSAYDSHSLREAHNMGPLRDTFARNRPFDIRNPFVGLQEISSISSYQHLRTRKLFEFLPFMKRNLNSTTETSYPSLPEQISQVPRLFGTRPTFGKRSSNEKVIVVMGKTGAGKSSFVSKLASDYSDSVGHGLKSRE